MTPYDEAIEKVRLLPEPLVHEVSDFIDFLVTRHNSSRWELWVQFADSLELAEGGFSSYLSDLEDYEAQLANGEIKW